MKLYERIENNNFDEIDRNRAIELIEGGNIHLVYNENYFKLQKENEELKERIREHTLLISPYYVKENFIPKQKVKDKIEEINKNLYTVEHYETIGAINVLQELLEGRK